MKNEDTIAEFLLKEAKTQDALRERISESAFDYYTGRHLFGLIGGLLLMGVILYVFVNRDIPIWGLLALFMSGTALMESKRNSRRVDAMVRLSNLQASECGEDISEDYVKRIP